MKAQKKDAPVLKATGPVMIDNWVIDYLEKHGPSSTFRVPVFAARTLNATGPSRVTLSLR